MELTHNELTGIIITGLVMMICVGLPLILHHRRAQRSSGGAGDARAAAELVEMARRMEQRLAYLERVLDTEAPGWRDRSDVR